MNRKAGAKLQLDSTRPGDKRGGRLREAWGTLYEAGNRVASTTTMRLSAAIAMYAILSGRNEVNYMDRFRVRPAPP